MTTVKELIKHLLTLDQNLPVAYRCMSEQLLLDTDELQVKKLCLPRNDGWIQNQRPDMPTQEYLLFPGN